MNLPTAQTTKDLLEAINQIRQAHNLKPVQSLMRGRRFDVFGCPLSLTLGWGTTIRIAVIPGEYRWGTLPDGRPAPYEKLPKVLEKFRKAFDEGDYTGLCLRR